MGSESWLVGALRDSSPLLFLLVLLGGAERMASGLGARQYLPWAHAAAFLTAGYWAVARSLPSEATLSGAYVVLVECAVLLLPPRHAIAVVAGLMSLMVYKSGGAHFAFLLNALFPPLMAGLAALAIVSTARKRSARFPAWSALLLAALTAGILNFVWAQFAAPSWSIELAPLSWGASQVTGLLTQNLAFFVGTVFLLFAFGALRLSAATWEEQSQQLHQFKRRADSLVKTLPDTLLVVNERQQVIEVVAYGHPLLPYLEEHAVLGRSLRELVPAPYDGEAQALFEQVLSEGAAPSLVTPRDSPDGRRLHTEWRFLRTDARKAFVLVRDVTDSQALRIRLSTQAAEIQALQSIVSDLAGVWTPERGTRWLVNSQLAPSLCGSGGATSLLELTQEPDRQALADAMHEVLELPGETRLLQVTLRIRGSAWARYEVRLQHASCLENPSSSAVLFLGQDLTEKADREATESWGDQVLAQAPQPLAMLDIEDGSLKWANPAFTALTGYALPEALGQSLDGLLHSAPGGAPMPGMLDLSLQPQWSGTFSSRRRDGTWFQELRRVQLFEDNRGQFHILVAQQELAEKGSRMVVLSTPSDFVTRAHQALKTRGGEPVTVVVFGVSRWEAVYRQKGQSAFDGFATEARARLTHYCETPLVSMQIAADRIAVLFAGRPTPDYACDFAKAVSAANNPPWFSGASLRAGLATKIHTFDGVGLLLERATFAFEQACSSTATAVICHRRDMDLLQDAQGSVRRRAQDTLLSHADVELVLQPTCGLTQQGLAGAVVWAKWQADVKPSQFAPPPLDCRAANDALTCLTLSTLCRRVQTWTGSGIRPMRFILSVSPEQVMRPDFVTRYTQIVRDFQVFPGMFSVTLDADACMRLSGDDLQALSEGVRRLRVRGFSAKLEHVGFGQGLSALIGSAAWAGIILDKRLVQGLGSDAILTGVCDTLLRRAALSNLAVIAPGVATAEQARHLAEHACQAAYGPYFEEPMRLDSFEELMFTSSAAPRLQAGPLGLQPDAESRTRALKVLCAPSAVS